MHRKINRKLTFFLYDKRQTNKPNLVRYIFSLMHNTNFSLDLILHSHQQIFFFNDPQFHFLYPNKTYQKNRQIKYGTKEIFIKLYYRSTFNNVRTM